MSVNSKADKTGGYKLHHVSSSGGHAPAKRHVPPYTHVTPPAHAAPAAQGMVQAGAKALAARAKRELSPLADPHSAITE